MPVVLADSVIAVEALLPDQMEFKGLIRVAAELEVPEAAAAK